MRRSPAMAGIVAALVLCAPAWAIDPGPPSGRSAKPPAAKAKPAAKPVARSWADSAIRTVTASGLLGGDAARFRPYEPLTKGELAELVAGLTEQPLVPPAVPSARVSLAGLDSALVRALGLAEAAGQFTAAARAAGLQPPTRFGSEVVARLLGLRTNHPAAHDDLELRPADPATRAEAAFSAARVLALQDWEIPSVVEAAESFALPALTPWQRRILDKASSFIGYPYVWGGTSEKAEAPFGVEARGGFDCSGFVWRVYKLESYEGTELLAGTLRGRTTFAMSGEVPAAKHISFARLQPADVVFFGSNGPRSKPAAVDHMGIYLGNGWMVHSSRYGVALVELEGYYRSHFAWGRRPLAEAGLAPSNGG